MKVSECRVLCLHAAAFLSSSSSSFLHKMPKCKEGSKTKMCVRVCKGEGKK